HRVVLIPGRLTYESAGADRRRQFRVQLEPFCEYPPQFRRVTIPRPRIRRSGNQLGCMSLGQVQRQPVEGWADVPDRCAGDKDKLNRAIDAQIETQLARRVRLSCGVELLLSVESERAVC